jgi:hypothetical protein
LFLKSDNTLHLYLISDWSTTNYIDVSCNVTGLGDSIHHHLVVSYDGSSLASGIKFYIDGIEKTITIGTDNLSASMQSVVNASIAARGAGAVYFTGSIDEVRIYNCVLSLLEVKALKKNPSGTSIQGLSSDRGVIGGWTINPTTISNGTNIILDAVNKSISINNSTYGSQGIQLQYNSGTPRLYVGNGLTKYFEFDGTDASVGSDSLLNGRNCSLVQERAEEDYLFGVFRGHQQDNLTVTVSGLTLTRYPINTFSGGSNGTTLWRMYTNAGLGIKTTAIYTWDDDLTFFARIRSNTMVADGGGGYGSSEFWGFINNGTQPTSSSVGDNGATRIVRHVGFFVGRDNKLYGSTADGATQTLTEITGIIHSNENNYIIEFESGVEARFYVNDVLKLTITTNLPSGATNPPDLCFEGRNGRADIGGNYILIYNNYKFTVNKL